MLEEFTLEKPVLRTELPEDVIGYLEKTYPARVNGAGLKQKDSVNYLTEEQDFLEDDAVIQCTEQYGLEPLGLLWFLRLYMAKDLGWGMDISTEKKRKLIGSEMYINYNISSEKLTKLSNALIDCGIIKVVKGSDGGTYWTTLQQFYNYEYKTWSRLKNNFAKRKSYKKNKTQNEDSVPTTEISAPTVNDTLIDNPYI